MTPEDELAAALPEAPPPSPAQRRIAIEAALHRFDTGEDAAVIRPRRQAGPWVQFGRSQKGALAGVMLAIVLGLPLVWLSLPNQRVAERPPTTVEQTERAPATSVAAPEPTVAEAKQTSVPQNIQPSAVAEAAGTSVRASAEPLQAPPPPPPPPPALDKVVAENRADAAPPTETEARQETVAGLMARQSVRAPAAREEAGAPIGGQFEQSSKVADYASAENIVVTGSRIVARGDWNACTVDDPERNLAKCRRLVGRGTAAERVVDGLSKAWDGDYGGAIAAFDQAIAIAPKSSVAHLNRGLALRRNGEAAQALAELDLAVRYDPGNARAYYNRSLVQQELGNERRSRADEARARDLDSTYPALPR